MTNPTLWLDIIVGTAGVGAVGLFVAQSRYEPSPKKGQLKRLAGHCFAVFLVLVGTDLLLTRALTPRLYCTGTITWLSQSHGKGAHSYLTVTDPSGAPYAINIGSGSSALQRGEVVRAEYLAGNGSAVKIDVLSGPNQGRQLTDPPLFGWGLIIFGGYVAFQVEMADFPNSNGETTEPSGDEPPSDGIDEKSLLNLDKP